MKAATIRTIKEIVPAAATLEATETINSKELAAVAVGVAGTKTEIISGVGAAISPTTVNTNNATKTDRIRTNSDTTTTVVVVAIVPINSREAEAEVAVVEATVATGVKIFVFTQYRTKKVCFYSAQLVA